MYELFSAFVQKDGFQNKNIFDTHNTYILI